MEELVSNAAEENNNIHFHSSVPYTEIIKYSSSADFGLNSIENICLSYYYCLPNKLFEYMQAGIPIITTPLPDCAEVVTSHDVGFVIKEFSVDAIRETMLEASKMPKGAFADNLSKASQIYNWENEEQELKKIYQPYLNG